MKNPLKIALVATMFELLDSTKHSNIGTRIRFEGGSLSPEVVGTRASFRPDLFGKNGRGKLVLVETVTKDDMTDLDKLKDKLYLFYTASESYGWDFHLACYAAVAPHLKRFCRANTIRFSKLWEV